MIPSPDVPLHVADRTAASVVEVQERLGRKMSDDKLERAATTAAFVVITSGYVNPAFVTSDCPRAK